MLSSSPLKIARNEDNVLMIDFCDIEVGNEITKDLNTYYAADKVYKYYGFKNGNPWNTSVQFKTNIVDRDTFGLTTGFSATYHFPVKGKFDFSKIKAPLIWYDILHVLDILSYFKWARKDKRFKDMLSVVESKADDDGRYVSESVWTAWKDWDFSQKKVPSSRRNGPARN